MAHSQGSAIAVTVRWMSENALPNYQYEAATHWPMVEAVDELSVAVMEFWDSLTL